MERIFLSRLIITIFLFISSNIIFGQHNYYVFKKEGNPYFKENKKVERGEPFLKTDILIVKKKDTVILVNELGEIFKISEPMSYSFSEIKLYKHKLEEDSFTRKYFKYVWKQFTNQNKRKLESGVVYREKRDIKLKYPIDSAKVYSPEVQFSWNNKTESKEVYFFLKDLEANRTIKLRLNGNSIMLYLDNYLLNSNTEYQWWVDTTPFPDLTQIEFHNLNILDKKEYQKLEEETAVLIKTFKILGFTEEEIKEAICVDYKFCR
ncbi:hypothetical protein CLV91_0729 [Maribacter vaceletii]|uniref:Uncharacterized protein n=1 Tax=Maribacter vaceletii TaxID=1206816 RepID=A0A495EDB6_9FLAO|nr:hypothetical protein [Maribacter vaceletii]RKR14651.1 hypothetical protein CLV91_0729 [Maribacter vaceletii]